MKTVKLLRPYFGRHTGQSWVLPSDAAQKLIDSGVAEAANGPLNQVADPAKYETPSARITQSVVEAVKSGVRESVERTGGKPGRAAFGKPRA